MARKVGNLTRRWAEGPGKQSGLWALSALALAAMPMLHGVRATCGGEVVCQQGWDKLFFLPNLLFVPAILAVGMLCGSWAAQRLHGRRDKRFYAALEVREFPDIPPGHMRPVELERDLVRRTMRWAALGALAAVGVFVYLAMTPFGRRACDPWRFKSYTGLEVCEGPAQWLDALVAYEVWLFVAVGALLALAMLARARRFSDRHARRVAAAASQHAEAS